jgi:hypothetical protein
MHPPRARWLLLSVVLLAGLAVAPATVVASSPLAPAAGYANLNSPSAHILLGSPLPQVEIQPAANASIAATLSLVYLLELAPTTSNPTHPQVVAEAAPETLAHFNGSISPDHTEVNLIATLPVLPAASPLWVNGTGVPQTTGVAQQAILDVNYSVATGSDGSPGVLVSWSVSGWPWTVPAGDELALEYVVQVIAGSGFETCTGTPTTSAPDSGCASQSLSTHQAVWGSALTALKGTGPAGSVVWVSWGRTVGSSEAQPATVNAGVYAESADASALVIAAPADGAAAVSGSTLFLLSSQPASTLVGALVGNLPAYGGAAALFAAAAATGIVLSRRRDRAIERELSG